VSLVSDQPSSTNSTAPATTSARLTWLLFVFVVLLTLWAIPYLMQQWAYRAELGKQAAWRESFQSLDQKQLASINQLFASVAKRLNPSVVHIDTRRRVTRNDEFSSLFGNRNQQTEGEASGVIVDARGYIVTNYHVIDSATEINVHLSDGKQHFKATVVGSDPKNDLAVLKINAPNLVPAVWGDSDQLEVGELVWAMGNPFGLDNSLTMGIVSAKGRRFNERQRYQEYLQTDAAVNPGNSGGPLVNLAGQVVGINTAIVGPTYQGISFAIPSNSAKDIYEQIVRQGKVATASGYLGVGLVMVNEELRQSLRLPDGWGAAITTVAPSSPAEQAGLRQGDVIRRWNKNRVEDPALLSYWVARTPPETKVPVEIIRNGQPFAIEVIVGERPQINE
jgi:serine protease Do